MKYFFLSETDSTNLHASALLSGMKRKETFCVVSDFQRNGRGQGRNKWISEPGLNILLSFVVFPSFLDACRNFFLSQIAAISISECLKSRIQNLRIKWPNDILAGNKKISGILIENSILGNKVKHSIIGMGINVNQSIFPDLNPEATSILNETGNITDIKEMIGELEKAFTLWYSLLENESYEQIRQHYYRHLAGFGRKSRFLDIDSGKAFEAVITGVLEDGRLLLLDSCNQYLSYGFKEIEMIF